MTETNKTLLEPIQNRLNAATPGPWHLDRDEPGEVASVVAYARNDGVTIGTYVADTVEEDGDAVFIANAPTDQARLLAAVQAVTAIHEQDTYDARFCRCNEYWPCSTTAAIQSALTEAR
jgi:hypothetical protein